MESEVLAAFLDRFIVMPRGRVRRECGNGLWAGNLGGGAALAVLNGCGRRNDLGSPNALPVGPVV